MKKYKISTYVDGVQKSKIVFAKDEIEATNLGWELFDADTIYVSEVEGE